MKYWIIQKIAKKLGLIEPYMHKAECSKLNKKIGNLTIDLHNMRMKKEILERKFELMSKGNVQEHDGVKFVMVEVDKPKKLVKCTCEEPDHSENQMQELPCDFEIEMGNYGKVCDCCEYCRYQCYLET